MEVFELTDISDFSGRNGVATAREEEGRKRKSGEGGCIYI